MCLPKNHPNPLDPKAMEISLSVLKMSFVDLVVSFDNEFWVSLKGSFKNFNGKHVWMTIILITYA